MTIKTKSHKHALFDIMNAFFSAVGFNAIHHGKISNEYSLLNSYNESDASHGPVLKLRQFKLYSD